MFSQPLCCTAQYDTVLYLQDMTKGLSFKLVALSVNVQLWTSSIAHCI